MFGFPNIAETKEMNLKKKIFLQDLQRSKVPILIIANSSSSD